MPDLKRVDRDGGRGKMPKKKIYHQFKVCLPLNSVFEHIKGMV